MTSHHVRTYLLTGLVVAAPMALTVYLFLTVIGLIDRLIRPLVPDVLVPFAIPGFGVLVLIGGLILLGAVTVHLGGRFLLNWAEAGLMRLPLVRSIYKPIKQVIETVASPTATSFREVALIDYPRPGCKVLAFVTGSAHPSVAAAAGEEQMMLFVPTTPNLYSGFLVYLPRSAVEIIAMPVDEAIRTLVTAGTAAQPERSSSAAASRSNR